MMIQPLNDVNPGALTHDEPGFGGLETARGLLPLKSLTVRAQVGMNLAQTTLTQTFVNTHAVALEATYIFPLPARAAISHFVLTVAGRQVIGRLDERGAARETYNQAIASGHRAAIAEQERPDVFTMRVGNLPPGEQARVELVMVAPLETVGGEVTYRFPLVVAPRYIPGTPLGGEDVGSGTAADTDAVPDASRISPPVLLPGFPDPVRLSIEVELDTGGPELVQLGSSLHAIVVESSRRHAHVRIEPGERLDRDFILRWNLASDAVSTSALLAPSPAHDDEKIVHVTLVPPRELTLERVPRDVVFVLDRSGSMGGWKMVAARRAMGRMIDALAVHDRFSVLAFDTQIETLPGYLGQDLIEATNRNRYRAMEFLAGVEARGGTEMAQPLSLAARALGQSARSRHRWIVLVTDGQVGNESQILSELSASLHDTRVFTVGIDRAVNAGFLQALGKIGQGGCELVESEDRLDEVMDRVHHAIDTPVLSHVTLELEGGAALMDPTPERVAGLFPGAPLTLLGRVSAAELGQDAHVVVRAKTSLGDAWSARIPLYPTTSPSPGVIWARERLSTLEDRYTIGQGSKQALHDELIKISLAYGVLCRFTAFVAVDREEVIRQQGELRQLTQPVEAPEGWGGGGPGAQAKAGPVMRRSVEYEAHEEVDAFASAGAMPAKPISRSEPVAQAAEPSKKEHARVLGRIDLGDLEEQLQGRAFASLAQDEQADDVPFNPARRARPGSSQQGRGGERARRGSMVPASAPATQPAPPRAQAPVAAVRGKRAGEHASQTQAGVLRERLHHLSPEQIGGTAELPADVWAVGVLCFELLTGEPMFKGDSVFDTLERISLGKSRALPATCPPELARLIRAATQLPAHARPEMSALAAELGELLADAQAAQAQLAELVTRALAAGVATLADEIMPQLDRAQLTLTDCMHRGELATGWRGVLAGEQVFVKILSPQHTQQAQLFEQPLTPGVPGTPEVIAAGMTRGQHARPYVVLPYHSGVTLEGLHRAHAQGVPEQVAIFVAHQLALILAQCHALMLPGGKVGVLHGEVRAGHILVDEQGAVQLLDFGAGVDLKPAVRSPRQPLAFDWEGFEGGAQVPSPPAAPERKGVLGRIVAALRGDKVTPSPQRDDFWK